MKTEKHWHPQVVRYLETIQKIHAEKNIDSPLDESTLFMFCENYNLFLTAQRCIQEEGILITNNKGVKITNPAVSISLRCQNLYLSLLKELGLSAKARKYIKSEAKEAASPLDQLLDFATEIDG